MTATARRESALESHVRGRLKEKPILLMAHAVVGYPSLDDNWRMLEAMDAAGVDVVELQLPFSEPIADGPTFVKANQEALGKRIHWDDYFSLMKRAAERFRFPLLFMGYYNSAFRMGEERFCERLAAAGARGFIIADLPPEEARDLNAHGRARGLDPVLLMTPTSSEARLAEIGAQASGLIYCVARKGVTGKHTDLSSGVGAFIARCRKATSLPLAVGFGIKTPGDVRSLRGIADVAIVGTACLEAWEKGGPEGYAALLNAISAETKARA